MESSFLKRFKIKLSKHNGNFDIPVSIPIDKSIKDSQVYGYFAAQANQDSSSLLLKNPKNSSEASPILPKIKTSEKITMISSASQKNACIVDDKKLKRNRRQHSDYIQSNTNKLSRRNIKVSQSVDLKDKEDLDISQEKTADEEKYKATPTPPKSISPIPNNNSGKFSYASRNSTADSIKRYKPYTMKDYIRIRPSKYIMLGGLGPNIGSENWKRASEIKERMSKYYKLIQDSYRSV
ncbi:unnamed protein product [Blepharisma stoltei]|uniref:Uncharacterized protein n=1 Tax=Blepharisma stoltei TaxID=1481888 RepID=A0AAU9JUL6_9CILI|nr:unnamed protein product [Blepharisma stoltei]